MADDPIMAKGAPAPVGAYPHARRVGDLLFLSGVGPRQPGTNAIPGGPIKDDDGNRRDYDMAAQVRATIENVKTILAASGCTLENVVDVRIARHRPYRGRSTGAAREPACSGEEE